MSIADPPPPIALAVAMQLVTRYRLRLADTADSRLGELSGDYLLPAAAWTGSRAAFAGFFLPPHDAPSASADVERRYLAASRWGRQRCRDQGASHCEILLVALAPLPPLPPPPDSGTEVNVCVIALNQERGRAEVVLGRPTPSLPNQHDLGRLLTALAGGAPAPTLAAVDLAERQAIASAYRQPAPRNWSAQPIATYGLIACFAAVYLVEFLATSTVRNQDATTTLVDMGALWTTSTSSPASIDWWRFVASAFLHDNSSPLSYHLIFNCMAMLFIGRLVEQVYGRMVLIGTFLLTAIGGGVVWFAAQNLTNAPASITIGASGGIMGLTGLLLVLGRIQGRTVPVALIHGIRSYAGYVVISTLLFGFIIPNVNNWAHAGGFATGAAVGLVIPPLRRMGGRDLPIWQKVVLIAVIALSAVALGFALANAVSSWTT